MKPDFLSLNAGTIVLLTPQTEAAARWAESKLNRSRATIEIDPRFFLDIAIGLLSDGLTLQDANSGRMASLANVEA